MTLSTPDQKLKDLGESLSTRKILVLYLPISTVVRWEWR